MPSVVVCDQGHGGFSCREAAILLAKSGSLGSCQRKGCGARRRYLLTQEYPGKGSAKFELERVVRLYTDEEAAGEGYDPMLFLLRRQVADECRIWLFYWTLNRHGAWHVGQFPPLLSLDEFRRLNDALLSEWR